MKQKIILTVLIIALVAVYFIFDLGQFLNFEYLKEQQVQFQVFYQQNRLLTIGTFALTYIGVTMLSIPGAVILTLAGGAIFGFWLGTIVVSFASTSGATLAFFNCRYLFRDLFQDKLKDKLKIINAGVERDGALFLFTMRLAPLFPFFLVNAAFAKTFLNIWTFGWVSQIGMLAGTMVYVNAGTQLAKLESLAGILSPQMLLAFILLGIFPLLAKKGAEIIKRRKVMRKFKRPKKFDYNIVVIGAGSGGLVVAYIAAAVKAKVALIEKQKMGGDCLNTGCVPSKALLRSAKMLHYAKRAEDWGFKSTEVNFDFADVMERVQGIIKQIEPHDSVERFTSLGVEVFEGEAQVVDPFRVRVNGVTLTTRNIILASGAAPLIPPIPGIKEVNPLTSDSLWQIRKLPERLIVVGGGPIGSEMAQAMSRFGSKVSLVEAYDCVLYREDKDVSDHLCQTFVNEGIDVLVNHRVKKFEMQADHKVVICESDGKEVRIECDEVLLALGRKANISGYGLEELGVELRNNDTIQVDEFLRTNYPNIYAVGDVTGPFQFTHFASHQAWYAAVNSLFSPLKKFKADYRVIPWTTFTDPEVARVGINEKEAQEKNIAYEVVKYDIGELDRAIADGENNGFVKILTVPGKDKILGVTIIGPHAGDILGEFVTAMKYKLGLNKILGTIHVYPTISEANKYAAGNWKKAHAPQKILRWLKKFHAWRR
ncbi:MAG: dihydrolipoyl dehydrogenase [Candidatus Marinimicrobia bacterium]|nr:dihydrolipoyl dehydrogenase [Candidatus Neomarinimicrobiota bacterium]